MSQTDLHRLAQHDTPNTVNVPPNWAGLAMWAAGRFGVGILFAGVFGWWLMTVYADLRRDADRVLTAFQQQAVANAQTVTALQQLTLAVERITTLQKDVDRNAADVSAIKRQLNTPKP